MMLQWERNMNKYTYDMYKTYARIRIDLLHHGHNGIKTRSKNKKQLLNVVFCSLNAKMKTYSFLYLQHNQKSQLSKVHLLEAQSFQVKADHIHCTCEHSTAQ